MRFQGKRTAFFAMLLSLSLILSYVEALIPVFFGVPGMKPGICNVLIVFILYSLGGREAILLNFMRILLTGMLFGNPYSILYSLSGAVLSFAVMSLLKKTNVFSIYGVSMAGGISHNIGQILVAMAIVENYRIVLYLPVLLISGCISGLLVAYLGIMVLLRVKLQSPGLR